LVKAYGTGVIQNEPAKSRNKNIKGGKNTQTNTSTQSTLGAAHQAPEKQQAFSSLLFAATSIPLLPDSTKPRCSRITAPRSLSLGHPHRDDAYAATGAAARPFSMPSAGASTLW
jgi:hypothetical protein